MRDPDLAGVTGLRFRADGDDAAAIEGLQRRFVPMADVEVDEQTRTFEGYAVRFGELNGHREIFMPGAFRATLANPPRGKKPSFYLNHDWNMIAGAWTVIREDDVGLFVRGRYLKSYIGEHGYQLALNKLAFGLSIGFTFDDFTVENAEDWQKRITYHKAVNLWEVSQVEDASDKTAKITDVRGTGGGAVAIRPDMTVREIESVLASLPGMSRDAAKAMASRWKPKGGEGRDAPGDTGEAELRDAAAQEAAANEADARRQLLKLLTS